MKRILLPLLLVTISAAASAQTPGTTTSAPPQTAAVPRSKIAVIYSGAFQDAKEGITRFAATVTKLNAEFQPIQNELNQTAQRLNALQEEIKKMQGGTTPATPQQIQAKIEQFDTQKKAYDRKGEDARLNYQRRRGELLMPLQEDVGKALDVFGKANGITMIIDGTQVPLVYAADTIDITKAFIADYNRRNPATTAATPR
ncbi:MAG TPA: OmpH family outer membrane protein [Pyrinomonadaceae bacterium]|nr:OmpH family outer membrane protein [Pyrinomonadaceae bacterium]